MALKPVKNDTNGKGYCGPTAIATITGKPLSKVLNTIREIWWPTSRWRQWPRKPRVAGVSRGIMLHALSELGYFTTLQTKQHVFKAEHLTIDRLAGENWTRRLKADALLVLTKPIYGSRQEHWVAVAGREVCDTWTGGKPVQGTEFKGRGDPVVAVFSVKRRSAPKRAK